MIEMLMQVATETPPTAVDWTTVLLALISALVSIATAFLAYLATRRAGEAVTQGKETAKAVDGVVTRMTETAEAKGRAEGALMGSSTGPTNPA